MNMENGEGDMSTEENKVQVLRFIEEAWHKGNLDIIDELYAPDFVFQKAPPGLPPDREGFKQGVAVYRAAFPDIRISVVDLIAEGDKLVIRWSWNGTHEGEFMGIPPTNKLVTKSGITIIRIVGGKVVERWDESDNLGLMQQLGVIPQSGKQR